jgi:hypothetical protein
LILDRLVSEAEILAIESNLLSVLVGGAGTRNLLEADWCRRMAESLRQSPSLESILPTDPVAVQCTYFEKSGNENWLVALHRDLSIPVKSRVQSDEWSRWSEKEGVLFVRPPQRVLETLVAVRIHLEDNTELNSPLQVVPRSHLGVDDSRHRVFCHVSRGGALVMRPLILHASSKLEEGTRRVLHFLIGPRALPNHAEWAWAV